ncbi:MAG: aldehyde dehydrogenase (NADP(+)) [Planctomycetota bacterium]|nr:aldehyde dehydrogenase (NADP(+)) [Planctomycetota bacterium]
MPASTFRAIAPATGQPTVREYRIVQADEVDTTCLKAAEAFDWLSQAPAAARSALLRAIAQNISDLGDSLIALASEETGLSHPRLAGERDRTVFTLRAFADAVDAGAWSRRCDDAAMPDRKPMPKPSLRRELVPLGPVAVFGASNFPLAYSTAGGDTASALAAGCPVVVKGHALHPGTGELVAAAIARAIESTGSHHAVFGYLGAGGDRDHEIGAELVTHEAIKSVGFTGSFKGGMALHRLCQSRPEPIPVFAEMGSINPIFILPAAASSQAESIADKLFASLSNSNGQMCTCPGLVFVVQGEQAEKLIARLAKLTEEAPSQTMLSSRMQAAFLARIHECAQVPGVDIIARAKTAPEMGVYQPLVVMRTTVSTLGRFETLHEECFGPSTIVVVCDDEAQMLKAAAKIPGSLSAAIFCDDPADTPVARKLAASLTRRVGRLVFQGVTTGVEVSPAMVHGGPFPATNQPQSTAVGTMAMERWCRPVCVQNAPSWLA